jgi:hypothetical protein
MRNLSLSISALIAIGMSSGAMAAVSCSCEHYGTQWDGVCEVHSFPTPFNGSEIFTWRPFGSAYMTYTPLPTDDVAIYNLAAGASGGLTFRVLYPKGQVKTGQCALGT